MQAAKTLQLKNTFRLESGERIEKPVIRYHTFGSRSPDDSNLIWVFHALSADSDVMDWWPGLFGEGCMYDPEKHFIVCANTLGSPYGTTYPNNLDFPQFTVRDVVALHLELAGYLGVQRINTIIGGSFGGNQALEFAYVFEGDIDRMVLIACHSRESAWGIAIHEAQRLALAADPTFGQPQGGTEGLKAARAMAVLHYRTSQALIAKQTDLDNRTDDFNAASYIRYQGHKFVERFDAICYYYLSKCLDAHNLGRGRGGEAAALRQIKIPTLVISIKTDMLVPATLMKFLAEHLDDAHFCEIESNYGHDGFLVETAAISAAITRWRRQHSRAKGHVEKLAAGKRQ